MKFGHTLSFSMSSGISYRVFMCCSVVLRAYNNLVIKYINIKINVFNPNTYKNTKLLKHGVVLQLQCY